MARRTTVDPATRSSQSKVTRVAALAALARVKRRRRRLHSVRARAERRGVALRATAEAEAMAQISQGMRPCAAKSATDAGLAMAQIYDALPHDDMSIDAIGSEFFPGGSPEGCPVLATAVRAASGAGRTWPRTRRCAPSSTHST